MSKSQFRIGLCLLFFLSLPVAGFAKDRAVSSACTVQAQEHFYAGIHWCSEQCNVTNSQAICTNAGEIQQGATYSDANAIRDGYELCQANNTAEKALTEAAFRDCPKDLINTARRNWGLPPIK